MRRRKNRAAACRRRGADDDRPSVKAGRSAATPAPGDSAGAPAVPPPSFDIVRVEPTGDAVIAGLAEPGATVELMSGDEAVATAEANERGEWAMALLEPLAPGPHDLAIRTTSPDKATVTISDQRVAVMVPETPTEEPLVVLNTPDAPSTIVQLPEPPPAPPAPAAGTETVVAAAPAPEPKKTEVAAAPAARAPDGRPLRRRRRSEPRSTETPAETNRTRQTAVDETKVGRGDAPGASSARREKAAAARPRAASRPRETGPKTPPRGARGDAERAPRSRPSRRPKPEVVDAAAAGRGAGTRGRSRPEPPAAVAVAEPEPQPAAEPAPEAERPCRRSW